MDNLDFKNTEYNPVYDNAVTKDKIIEFKCPECSASADTLCIETRPASPNFGKPRKGGASHQRRLWAAQDHHKLSSQKRDKGNWFREI